MNKKLFMLWSFLLCFALGVSAQTGDVFSKISTLDELTMVNMSSLVMMSVPWEKSVVNTIWQ